MFHDDLSAAGGTEKELMGEEVIHLATWLRGGDLGGYGRVL